MSERKRNDRGNGRPSPYSRACKFCGVIANIKGIASHERACKKKQENDEMTAAFLAGQQRTSRAAEARAAIEEADRAISRARAETAAAKEPSSSTHRRESMELDGPQNDDYNHDELDPRIEPQPVDQQTGLAIDDAIKIIYHPFSNKEEEINSIRDYRQRSKQSIPVESKPWSPFRTRGDFEFAEIVLAASMNAKHRKAMIDLIKRIVRGELEFTIESDSDLLKSWKFASSKLTGFKKCQIHVPFKKQKRSFTVYYRPIWNWALDLMKDQRIVSRFTWDACRLYKYDKDSNSYVRFYDEPCTAESFWNIQSDLPESGKPLCLIFYADKNKLSSFGTQKGYPVIVRCANLPVHIRNGEGMGGGMIVGWLPIVAEDAAESGSPAFVNFKTDVWHRAVDKILASIKTISKVGFWVPCGDGVERHVFPIVQMISADYEEQTVIALNRGPKGLLPCTVCEVPTEELSDMTKKHPLRTAIASKNTYELSQITRTLKLREEILKPKGQRPVKCTFWEIGHSDVHRALSWDRLHAYEIGLFASHLWPLIKNAICEKGRKFEGEVDRRFKAFPIWRDVYHFNGVMKLTFNDGKKHEDMSKQLFFVIIDLFNQDRKSKQYLYVLLLRSFIIMDIMLSFECHTEKTLDDAWMEFTKFADILKELIEVTRAEIAKEKLERKKRRKKKKKSDKNRQDTDEENSELDEDTEEDESSDDDDNEDRDEDEEREIEDGNSDENEDVGELPMDDGELDNDNEQNGDEEQEEDEEQEDEEEEQEDEEEEQEEDDEQEDEDEEQGEEDDDESEEDDEDGSEEENQDEDNDQDNSDSQTETVQDDGEHQQTVKRKKKNHFKKKKKQKVKNWNFIKAHSHQHAFDDIREKGVTRNYNTKPNEKLHGPLRNIYHRQTNYRDVAPQMLTINHYTLIATYIRSQLDVIDKPKVSGDNDEEEGAGAKKILFPPNDIYYLGAPQPPKSLSVLENENSSDLAFRDLRKKLVVFLNNHFRVYQITPPNNRYLTLTAAHTVVEFRFIKINYESKVTWEILTDYLRCSPMFFRRPRYDFVLVKTVTGYIFARLLSVFVISVDERPYGLALIQAFDRSTGPTRRKDAELGLWRVGAKPRESSEIISLDTIVRGALLVQDFESGRENEYIVMDVLDADMYMRVKEMREIP